MLSNESLLEFNDYKEIKYSDLNLTVFLKVVHIDQNAQIKALSMEEIKPNLNIKAVVNSDQSQKYDVIECPKDFIFNRDPILCLDNKNPKLKLDG